MMTERRRFLVVDGDESSRKFASTALSPFGDVLAVGELGAALELAERRTPFVGVVTELVFEGGSGFDLLAALRKTESDVPVLALTSRPGRERINRAHSLEAELVCKPTTLETLSGFARRAISHFWTRSRLLAGMVDAFAAERNLTAREAELVAAAVADMPRRLVAAEIGVSENTLKVQIRQLLSKCGASSLDELADGILRRAVVSEPAPEGARVGSG
jgi:DNA-binding NarL/FixJ family response regulator